MTLFIRIISGVLKNLFNQYGEENIDIERFSGCADSQPISTKWIIYIFRYVNQFNKTYSLLGNSQSRDVFIDILLYRMMGSKKIIHRRNNKIYWDARARAASLALEDATVECQPCIWPIRKFKLHENGFPLSVLSFPIGIATTFFLRHYDYVQDGMQAIKSVQGDVVVDAGGCFGDTALYFGTMVKETGKVYSFEFVPDNIRVFEKNLTLNPMLKENIHIVRHAVGSKTGKLFYFEDTGPSTHLIEQKNNNRQQEVSVLSIDDLVRKENLDRLDFIKMDIEGAELDALKGAITSIRRFKPKLAISVYHKKSDLVDIPAFIHSMDMGYKFYLEHYTIHAEESVLFAAVT